LRGLAKLWRAVKARLEALSWDILYRLPPKAISKLIKEIIKMTKINRIAEILKLNLEKGNVELAFKLKGEKEPINLSLNYTLEENTIYINKVETNKEWLDALVEVFKEDYSRINTSVFGKYEDKVKKLIIHLF